MSDKEALLRAIIAAPHDDTPRLVYADWLEEHKDLDHAEFIRGQIGGTLSPEQEAVLSGTLLMRALMQLQMENVRFHDRPQRGFLTPYVWLNHLPNAEAELDRLAALPAEFPQVEVVMFCSPIREVLPIIDRHRVTDRLQSLDFHGNNSMSAADIRALAQCRNLHALRELHFNHTFIDASLIGALAKCTNLQQLHWLDLGHNRLSFRHIESLAACTNFQELGKLSLGHNSLDAGSIRALAKCNFPKLRFLDLSNNNLDTAAIEALRGCRKLRQLERLDICSTRLTEESIDRFCTMLENEKQLFPALRHVETGNSDWNARIQQAIAARAAKPKPAIPGNTQKPWKDRIIREDRPLA